MLWYARYVSSLDIIMHYRGAFQWGEKQISSFTIQPSEIRGLCLTKLSSKTLKNLLYFMYKKTHAVSFLFFFLPYECPGLCQTKAFINEKQPSRFWSISLDQFVENRLLTYEECSSQMEHVLWSYNYIYFIYYILQVTTIQVHLSVCLWQHQASFFKIAEQWSKIAHERAALTDVIIIGCKSQKLNR